MDSASTDLVVTWIIIVVVLGLIFGVVGLAIAANKGVSSAAGFWLGAFLGPVGLIIVALLNPPPPAEAPAALVPKQFVGEPALTNDAYKLWLTDRYRITRNEVLGKFVCEKRLFPTVEASLEYASEQHRAEVAATETAQREKAERLAKLREDAEQRQRETDEWARRNRPYFVGGGAFLLIIASYGTYATWQSENERAAAEARRAAARRAAQVAALAPVNKVLAPFGLAIGENGYDPATDTDASLCEYSDGYQGHKILGKSAHFSTATYPTNETVHDVKIVRPDDWAQDLNVEGGVTDGQWLYVNQKAGTTALIVAQDETNYKAPASELIFKTRVHICVGKSIGS